MVDITHPKKILKLMLSNAARVSFYELWIPFILFALTILVLGNCYLSSFWESILTASLVSFFFYFLVVYIPAYIRKQNQKKVFLDFYDDFKEGILREVLVLSNFEGDEYEKIEQLKNSDNFTNYCLEPSNRQGQTNWNLVQDHIGEEEYKFSLKNIVVKVSELQREIDFLIRSVGVGDRELLSKFRNLDRTLLDGRYTEELDWNQGDDDRLTNSLYELLSGWSYITGETSDFIKEWAQSL
jgi:hypothetical protein